MFYVKEKISNAVELSTELTEKNVYSRCPKCGKEVQVNLEDVFSEGDVDLSRTSVLCEDCTDEILGGGYCDK